MRLKLRHLSHGYSLEMFDLNLSEVYRPRNIKEPSRRRALFGVYDFAEGPLSALYSAKRNTAYDES